MIPNFHRKTKSLSPTGLRGGAGKLRRGLYLLALAVALLAPSQGAGAGEAHEAGRAVYNFRCYFCHGYSGDARTLAARFLEPRPRDFTAVRLEQLPRGAMIEAVTHGRPGTAMKPFADILTPGEIAVVVDFIRDEFMGRGLTNTRYHTPGNGWPDHARYAPAFPFATGEIPLDTPWSALSETQRRGRRIYFNSCISCHDRSGVLEEEVTWEREALSYPRFDFKPGDAERPPDEFTGASSFARHDIPPVLDDPTPLEKRGEAVFQANCAFCHGADGTGKNWIGAFLQPHPRNLSDPEAMRGMTREALVHVIRDGLPGTSMPAWGGVLSRKEVEAVIAYISKVFHPLPSGAGLSSPHVHNAPPTRLRFERR